MKKTARLLILAMVASLLTFSAGVTQSSAAPGKLTENFNTAELVNPSNWYASTSGGGPVHPCLSALSSSQTIALSGGTTLAGCTASTEANGMGALFLTTADGAQAATMLYNKALPTAGGLDISFFQAQYGGDRADGISFFVKDGTNTDLTVGIPGGGLGYKGIHGALFGVGFDAYGNWKNSSQKDSACVGNSNGTVPQTLIVRGPDTSANKDGSSGFCILPGGMANTDGVIGAEYFGNPSDTRANAARPVRILVDPSTLVNPKIRIYMWKSGSLTQDLTTAPIQLTVDQPAEYIAASTMKFGFSASTGGATDNHAIWGLQIAPQVTNLSPTVYIVPENATVRAGEAAVYTYKFYKDAAHTTEFGAGELTYSNPVCTSTYSAATNYTTFPTTLPITCTDANVALHNVVATDTAVLTINRGTPSISPATTTVTGNANKAINATAGFTSRNFLNAAGVRYAISPALPAGLAIDAVTGVISGTPTAASTATYTVTGTSGAENATASVSIAIATPVTHAYTITFDKGTGTSGTLATQTGAAETSVALSLFSTSNMVKPGYHFTGWLSANSTAYTDGQVIPLTGAVTLALTAQWAINTYAYEISFYPNGGTGTMAKISGTNSTIALPANTFTRSGYTFVGWKDDSATAYSDSQTVTLTAPTTLVLQAQWVQGKVASISPATTTISAVVGTAMTPTVGYTATNFTGAITYSINPALPAGLIFNTTTGAISGTPTAAKPVAAHVVTATSATESATAMVDVVISAVLTFPYAISFDANGGTGTMAGQTGAAASVKLSTNTFTRVGHTFTGWKDDAGATYSDGQSVALTTTTSLALHAQWAASGSGGGGATDNLTDKITSISPASGYANDEITITGEFNHVITSISVDGLLLPANSWKQDKTTVKFAAPGHATGVVDIKLGNGLTPELPTQKFEYLALKALEKEIGIDGILCLGTFDKSCSLKPGAAQPVSFKVGSNALSAKSIKILKSWKLQSAKNVIVYGYASKAGSKALNDKLTKKRAAEVGAWVKKNWPNLSVKTVGLGTKINRLCKAFDNKCAMIKIVSLKK